MREAYHQDVSNHLHGLVVVVPSELELSKKHLSLCRCNLFCDPFQVLLEGTNEAIVEVVTKFIDDHVVGIPASMKGKIDKAQGTLCTTEPCREMASCILRSACQLSKMPMTL